MADYDRDLIIDMLQQYLRALITDAMDNAGQYLPDHIVEQIDLLREADSRESREQTVSNPDSAAHDGGVAVRWECRRKNTITGEWMDWQYCSREFNDEIKRGDFTVMGANLQARVLYTTPAAAPDESGKEGV
jgi:hypothetical protein